MANKFKPNPDQLKLLEAFVSLEPNEDHTITRVCINAGCTRNMWYRSVQNPAFVDWFADELSKHVKTNLTRVWGAMAGQAIKGEVSAAKLYVERFDPGYKPTIRSEETHTYPQLESDVPAAGDIRAKIEKLAGIQEK